MSAEDPGDINVDDLDLGDIGDSGVDADVDISGDVDPGDIRVDVDDDPDPSDDGLDAGGFGEELGGDPAGDAGRDTGAGADPAPEVGDGGGGRAGDLTADDLEEATELGAAEAETTQGVETERGGEAGLGLLASEAERRVLEENPELTEEDVRIEQTPTGFEARLTKIGEARLALDVSDPAVSTPVGGFEQIRGGARPSDRRRLVSSLGFDVRGGQPQLALVGRGSEDARQSIEAEFESELGMELSESDIEFEQRDGQVVGRLTPEARQELRVQQEPLVRITQDTPFEEVFEEGGRIGARQSAQRTRRRRRLFGEIGQREQAEEFVEDIGLGDERREFESLQASAQSELASLRRSVFDAGGRAAAIASAPVAVPLGIAAERTGTPPSAFEDIPSPAEEPAAFAAAAAPVAAAEPTPFGELAVGGAVLVGGTLLAAERQQQQATVAELQAAAEADLEPTLEPVSSAAMAEPPGLFLPEHEQPTAAIGRGFFPADFPIGPSRQEVPELLPPTDPKSDIQTGRLTRPELEVPDEPAVSPFPAEIPTPQEPTGEGLFPPEQEVPTAEAAALVGELRETRERLDRERRRQQRVPEEMLPDEPVTIGGDEAGEADPGLGEGTTGPAFIVRPDPRSMELRRIETEEGEFEVGPELTRFLEATALEQFDEPELEPTEEGAMLPPAQDVGGEFAAAAAAQRPELLNRLGLEPVEEQLSLVDTGVTPTTGQLPLTEPITDLLQQPGQGTAQRTDTAQITGTTTPGLTEAFPPENIELTEETVVFPTPTTFAVAETPAETQLPLLDPDADERRPEPERLQDFERRFEFEVLEPGEALQASSGLEAGEPDTT